MDKNQPSTIKITFETATNNSNNRYTHLLVSRGVGYHKHEDFFEFFFVVSGKAEHTPENRETEVISIGDAYLLRPGDCHKAYSLPSEATPYSHRDVYASVEDMQKLCRFAAPDRDLYGEILEAPGPIKFYMTYHDVRAIEAQAIRLASASEPLAEQCYRAIVLYLLNLCCTSRNVTHYPQWLNKLLSYINSSVTRKRSVSEYVETTGYCHEYVSRQFKRYTGYRLNEYIKRTKLEYAKTLLSADEENSIAQIAYYLGFLSESKFIAAFKNLYGITPLQWKKNEKKGKSI